MGSAKDRAFPLVTRPCSLRWHYPSQVQRVEAVRASSQPAHRLPYKVLIFGFIACMVPQVLFLVNNGSQRQFPQSFFIHHKGKVLAVV